MIRILGILCTLALLCSSARAAEFFVRSQKVVQGTDAVEIQVWAVPDTADEKISACNLALIIDPK